MAQRQKPGADEQALRDQEVLRANRELAAYFRGKRTEREARAALKIVKAFVREREGQDAKTRPPLPVASAARAPRKLQARKPRRQGRRTPPRRSGVSTESQVNAHSEEPSDSQDR